MDEYGMFKDILILVRFFWNFHIQSTPDDQPT